MLNIISGGVVFSTDGLYQGDPAVGYLSFHVCAAVYKRAEISQAEV